MSVKGVQHFDSQGSKNSADIAIAVDAVVDFTQGNVNHVVVFSDDSDYISLFDKIIELSHETWLPNKRAPFLWILTNRSSNKSTRINEFMPQEYLHYVGDLPSSSTSKTKSGGKVPITSSNRSTEQYEEIAIYLIRELPVGKFKSTDCKKIVKGQFSQHPMSNLSDAAFGTAFLKELWPFLQRKGVEQQANTKPLRYEMTQAAKDAIETK